MIPLQVLHLQDGRIEVQVWQVLAADPVTTAPLNPQERHRASQFRLPADADRFVTGRFALRSALSRRQGIAPQAIAIEIDPQGRPFCPAGTGFSLSHSGDFVVLALCDDAQAPLGIDIEREDRKINIGSLLSRTCTPAEVAWINANLAEMVPRFFELWTCKEAALKSTGLGLGIDPRSAIYDWTTGQITFAENTGLAPVNVIQLNVPRGYKAALAIGLSA